MEAPGFNEEEWSDVFSHLRMLVITSGYATWDSLMVDSLNEEENEMREPTTRYSSHSKIKTYTEEFYNYLSARSTAVIVDQKDKLGVLLRTKDGRPVNDAKLSIEGEEISILARNPGIDNMLYSVNQFILMIRGDNNDFLEEISERPETRKDLRDDEDPRDDEGPDNDDDSQNDEDPSP